MTRFGRPKAVIAMISSLRHSPVLLTSRDPVRPTLYRSPAVLFAPKLRSARFDSGVNTGRRDLFGAKSERADNERVIALRDEIHFGTSIERPINGRPMRKTSAAFTALTGGERPLGFPGSAASASGRRRNCHSRPAAPPRRTGSPRDRRPEQA
jgi:hypothetical protein